jgi:hypothetical protein
LKTEDKKENSCGSVPFRGCFFFSWQCFATPASRFRSGVLLSQREEVRSLFGWSEFRSERQDFLSTARRFSRARGLWARAWAYLSDPLTWKSLIFIALKFPLGIVLFTAVIDLLSAAAGMLFAPLAHLAGHRSFIIGSWRIDTWGDTFLASAMGLFALPLSLHLLNGLAFASGWFARVMLSDSIATEHESHQGWKIEFSESVTSAFLPIAL